MGCQRILNSNICVGGWELDHGYLWRCLDRQRRRISVLFSGAGRIDIAHRGVVNATLQLTVSTKADDAIPPHAANVGSSWFN